MSVVGTRVTKDECRRPTAERLRNDIALSSHILHFFMPWSDIYTNGSHTYSAIRDDAPGQPNQRALQYLDCLRFLVFVSTKVHRRNKGIPDFVHLCFEVRREDDNRRVGLYHRFHFQHPKNRLDFGIGPLSESKEDSSSKPAQIGMYGTYTSSTQVLKRMLEMNHDWETKLRERNRFKEESFYGSRGINWSQYMAIVAGYLRKDMATAVGSDECNMTADHALQPMEIWNFSNVAALMMKHGAPAHLAATSAWCDALGTWNQIPPSTECYLYINQLTVEEFVYSRIPNNSIPEVDLPERITDIDVGDENTCPMENAQKTLDSICSTPHGQYLTLSTIAADVALLRKHYYDDSRAWMKSRQVFADTKIKHYFQASSSQTDAHNGLCHFLYSSLTLNADRMFLPVPYYHSDLTMCENFTVYMMHHLENMGTHSLHKEIKLLYDASLSLYSPNDMKIHILQEGVQDKGKSYALLSAANLMYTGRAHIITEQSPKAFFTENSAIAYNGIICCEEFPESLLKPEVAAIFKYLLTSPHLSYHINVQQNNKQVTHTIKAHLLTQFFACTNNLELFSEEMRSRFLVLPFTRTRERADEQTMSNVKHIPMTEERKKSCEEFINVCKSISCLVDLLQQFISWGLLPKVDMELFTKVQTVVEKELVAIGKEACGRTFDRMKMLVENAVVRTAVLKIFANPLAPTKQEKWAWRKLLCAEVYLRCELDHIREAFPVLQSLFPDFEDDVKAAVRDLFFPGDLVQYEDGAFYVSNDIREQVVKEYFPAHQAAAHDPLTVLAKFKKYELCNALVDMIFEKLNRGIKKERIRDVIWRMAPHDNKQKVPVFKIDHCKVRVLRTFFDRKSCDMLDTLFKKVCETFMISGRFVTTLLPGVHKGTHLNLFGCLRFRPSREPFRQREPTVASSTLSVLFPSSSAAPNDRFEIINDVDHRDSSHVYLRKIRWTEEDMRLNNLLPVDDRECISRLAAVTRSMTSYAEFIEKIDADDDTRVVVKRASDENRFVPNCEEDIRHDWKRARSSEDVDSDSRASFSDAPMFSFEALLSSSIERSRSRRNRTSS